jgi:hypothetical protein
VWYGKVKLRELEFLLPSTQNCYPLDKKFIVPKTTMACHWLLGQGPFEMFLNFENRDCDLGELQFLSCCGGKVLYHLHSYTLTIFYYILTFFLMGNLT